MQLRDLVETRSATTPRKTSGYQSELAETRLRGGVGVVLVSNEAVEVEGSAEISRFPGNWFPANGEMDTGERKRDKGFGETLGNRN